MLVKDDAPPAYFRAGTGAYGFLRAWGRARPPTHRKVADMKATQKIIPLGYAAIALLTVLSASPAAQADPMKCSNEEKTCATNCKKAARGPVNVCLTECGTRASYCMKTGCWDTGVQRYCGLAKQ